MHSLPLSSERNILSLGIRSRDTVDPKLDSTHYHWTFEDVRGMRPRQR
jgi:hypothetical protein